MDLHAALSPSILANFLLESLHWCFIPHYVTLLLLTLFTHHLFFLRSAPNAPPLIRGSLPFFGSALAFLWDPEEFLLSCQRKYGDIFTLYMAGKRMHIICDPVNAIPAVYRNFKVFPFSVMANFVDINLFGLKEAHAKDTALYNANLGKLVPNLLSIDQVNKLIIVFNNNLTPILAREMGKLEVSGTPGPELGGTVELDNWLRRIMFECSGKAMFGKTWPEDDKFYDDFVQW